MAHPEQMLISALFNGGNLLQAEEYGVSKIHFTEYSSEYTWVIDFVKNRGYSPEYDVFSHAFPDFILLGITDVSFCCDLVREHYTRNQISSLARKVAEDLKKNVDPGEIISKISGETTRVISTYNTGSNLTGMFGDGGGTDVDYVLEMQDRGEPEGVPFFHESLRARAWGQRPGEMTVYAARTNQGKSWMLANEAAQAVLEGKKVLYWAGEMSERQMRNRLLTIMFNRSGITGFTHRMIDKGWDDGKQIDVLKFKQARQKLEESLTGNVFIPDMSHGLTTPTTIGAWCAQYEPDLVVVDHLSLMGDSTGQRATMGWNVLASITGELKQLAVSFQVPMLTASQINREGVSSRQDKPPKIHNLAQSDTVGQDADNVITMTKYLHGNTSLVMSLEKCRSSEAGLRWWSRFDANHGDFHEITKAEADELRSDEAELDDDL